MKHVLTSFRMTLFLMLVLGIAYPLLITAVAQLLFPHQANGSLVYESGQLRGSALIAQNFVKEEYFWPRPSAVSYDPLASGGSNLGPTAKPLQEVVRERSEKLKRSHTNAVDLPPHLIFASGSSLDPHQSLAAIEFQVPRVAAARGLSTQELRNIIKAYIERRQFGILGEEKVNVLALNLELDTIRKIAPDKSDQN